jgi:hypothetical protein
MKQNYLIPGTRAMIYLLIVPCLLMSGCAWIFVDRYQEYDDDFRNSRKVISRFNLRPEESKTEIGNAWVIFEKELSNREERIRAYFVISRATSSFKADNQGYIRIDDETYEIWLEDFVTEQKIDTETSSTSFIRSDSTSTTTGIQTSGDTRIWLEDKFMFPITSEMASRVEKCNKLTTRFYFGPIPSTYTFKGKDLDLLKKMLST